MVNPRGAGAPTTHSLIALDAGQTIWTFRRWSCGSPPSLLGSSSGARFGMLMVEGDVTLEERPRPWARRLLGTVFVLAVLATSGAAINVWGLGDTYDRISRNLDLPWASGPKDTDGDGLTDDVERAGWRTRGGEVFVTYSEKPDSDGDGLTDGQEAGGLVSGTSSTMVYAGLSKPVEFDTDGDGIGDGDEYFLDMNPRSRDSDDDGLLDDLELDFGSDPTLDNPDDDSYSDQEEYDRDSDPFAYDLGRVEAVAALVVGATVGDWEWGARRVGMDDAQLQSPEYLAGQIASGFIGVGDIRDIAANIGRGDLVGAVLSVIGLAPLVGDAAKIVATVTEFAKRGDRAERAATALLERLPWSKSTKSDAFKKIRGNTVRLPRNLTGGPEDNSVYKGAGYVGITNDFARRRAEHATAGRSFTPELIAGATKLSRGEARAIEEACIVQGGLEIEGGVLENQRHSISPDLTYYEDAVAWGNDFLKKSGGTCL